MNKELLRELSQFLKVNWGGEAPLLLALSGGPDSMALLLLLEQVASGKFHVAHVDHGWREESADEALKLKNLLSSKGIPFHTIRLSADIPKTEEAAREARYLFFEKLAATQGFSELLLAHHASDLAETALKRACEGAPLTALASMRPVAQRGLLKLLRPLLRVKKSALVALLDKGGHFYFTDRTNSGKHCLRGRMREEIFPLLSRAFGKEVLPGFCNLAVYGAELCDYLDKKIETVLAGALSGPFGICYDLSQKPLEPLEIKHLIRAKCAEFGCSMPKTALDHFTIALLTLKADFRFQVGGDILFIADRGRLFVTRFVFPAYTFFGCGLEEDSQYTVTLSLEKSDQLLSWQSLWIGAIPCYLPCDKLAQIAASPDIEKSKSLRARLSSQKIPAFLWEFSPYLILNGRAIHALIEKKAVLPPGCDHLLLEIKNNKL